MTSRKPEPTFNPLELDGIEFVELAGPNPQAIETLLYDFGFSKTMRHQDKNIEVFEQNDITFLLNKEPESHADAFQKLHGQSIPSMAWRTKNAKKALETAINRGAQKAPKVDYFRDDEALQALAGIGESIIYLVDYNEETSRQSRYAALGFVPLENPRTVPGKGFLLIDHLTNNVPKGHMETWSDFYKDVFGFTEVRYFDIRGKKTGLISYALRSPCAKFAIPINEGTESKSQIDEYLREYNGPGIQHLAFLTEDMLGSLEQMKGTSVSMLDLDPEYYKDVFDRVPNVTEDHAKLQEMQVLIDGDDDGYLLQIFTQNIMGPIFIELIQRKNHYAFGEGNFGALFRSIERDQEARGVL